MFHLQKAYAVDIADKWPLAQKFPSLGLLVTNLLPKALLLAGIVSFLLVVVAGLGVITGAGNDDPQAKEKSKNFLTYSVIGLIIIFGAYWILQIINFITKDALSNIL